MHTEGVDVAYRELFAWNSWQGCIFIFICIFMYTLKFMTLYEDANGTVSP